ncbi:MAG: peptide-N-glycosidase F-related protein [Flavobacteriales bacterium]|nr:peptide-N-glycosidase F-related protein [Flavobacteriales bacterium]
MKKVYLLFAFALISLAVINSCKKDEIPVCEDTSNPWDGVEGQVKDYSTFSSERLAFGGGFSQSSVQTFTLHNEPRNVQTIKMYVKLRCPTGGCNAWDVFANIKVKDDASGLYYEIGRFITPYGVDNSAFPDGYEIDVTDFKSLLKGSTELRAYIETWGSDGWEISVDFKYTLGKPDYEYYSVNRLLNYDTNSLEGIPYGVTHSKDLTRTVTIPSNAAATSLRTIITGWGHTTPVDVGGRPCAEWCFRTHQVKIDGSDMFSHAMTAMGCASNPTSNQAGNWSPDRAGWCPGMAVSVRVDDFSSSMAGNSFNFEYYLQPWTSNGGTTSGTVGAYYATSCFVIVKSNEPVSRATVVD